jgi:hypothetical protein
MTHPALLAADSTPFSRPSVLGERVIAIRGCYVPDPVAFEHHGPLNRAGQRALRGVAGAGEAGQWRVGR